MQVSGWTDDIAVWVEDLRVRRPVFHSEADFQHALAWAAHQSNPSLHVRLETRPAPGMRLDLLLSKPDINEHLALELKYLTAAWAGAVDHEDFTSLSQAAQDIRAYDVVKDIQRVEQLAQTAVEWRRLGPYQRSQLLVPPTAWPSNERRRIPYLRRAADQRQASLGPPYPGGRHHEGTRGDHRRPRRLHMQLVGLLIPAWTSRTIPATDHPVTGQSK